MPVYQDKNTKKWKVRVYVTDIYGNRKQIERNGSIQDAKLYKKKVN